MVLLWSLFACSPPPPAPEGLDASTSYMVQHFYDDDAMFQAGVQGFMAWYEAEGYELVGVGNDTDDTDSFTVGDLSDENVAHLPLEWELLLDGAEDTWGPRDMSMAKGVVSLAEMECDWIETEDYLVRPDQDAVFNGDWESYERTYLNDRDTFQAASVSGEFDEIEVALDPFADDFDPSTVGRSMLFTVNTADPTKVLTADMQPYELRLDLRHGIYDVGEEQLGAMAILTYNTEAVWDEEGKNALIQSFSIEVNVERPDDKTLRMLAVWAQPYGAGIEPDSALALNYAVGKSLDASIRLSDICSGKESIEE
ncbi:MAG: hypothetical protein VX899_19800 [Myxococcota bacterium]|nr:hypothetical protein [Myxococcota bacterium]